MWCSRCDRCFLLADVTSAVGLSRHEFTTQHPHIITHRLTWADFESQTMIADFKSIRQRVDDMHTNDDHRDEHTDTSIDTMSGSEFSDDDCLEVVTASVDLFNILGIEVVPLN